MGCSPVEATVAESMHGTPRVASALAAILLAVVLAAAAGPRTGVRPVMRLLIERALANLPVRMGLGS